MRPPWKYIGLAGLAGVAATGVVVVRRRRTQGDYDPEELREHLRHRLAQVPPAETADPPAPTGGSTKAGPTR